MIIGRTVYAKPTYFAIMYSPTISAGMPPARLTMIWIGGVGEAARHGQADANLLGDSIDRPVGWAKQAQEMPRRACREANKRAACGVCRRCESARKFLQPLMGVWRCRGACAGGIWSAYVACVALTLADAVCWIAGFLCAPTLVEFGLTGLRPAVACSHFGVCRARIAPPRRPACRMQAELEAQLAEVRSGGLVSAGTAERSTDGEDAASASITTLEGETMLLRMDLGGVRITERINPADGDGGPSTPPTMVYDCVSSLLLNTSAGYKAHFNSSLFAAL